MRICIVEEQSRQEHFHQEIEFIYVVDGGIDLILAGTLCHLTKESIILINSNRPHAWHFTGSNLLCRIYIDYAFLMRFLQKHFVSFWCNSLLNKDKGYAKLRSILLPLIREYSAQNGKDTFRMQAMKYQLLECLERDFLLQGSYKGMDIDDERIEQALEYINAHYAGKISLREAASQLFISEAYLSRLFKKVTGQNFIEYANSVRLHYAVESLLYSRKSVTVISEECGFSNPSAFNKLFKKTYGCSPTQYQSARKDMVVSAENIKGSDGAADRLKDLLLADKAENDTNIEQVCQITVGHNCIATYVKETTQCINMGLMVDLLQSELREHLKMLRDELGFLYVRIQNVFHRKMYIFAHSGDKLNCANIDNVLDYIVDLGMYPVIDFSLREKRAYLDFGKNLFVSEDENESIKPEEWGHLVRWFIEHVTDRYKDQVEKWMFEFDCCDYQKTGAKVSSDSIEIYEILWEVTWHAVKDDHPQYQLGGDGFCINSDYEALQKQFEFWDQHHCLPDFFSLYGYPYSRFSQEVYARRETDYNFMMNGLVEYKKNMEHYIKQNGKIIFTEWNTSISERNYYNDSCAKAAQLVRQMILFAGTDTMLCYHHGSDFLSQYFDSVAPFVGAVGLVSKHGIAKPAFYAFAFMNKLYPKIVYKSDCCIVTANQNGNYYILLCNAKKFNHIYYLKREHEIMLEDLPHIFEDDSAVVYRFRITDSVNNDYRIKKHLLSDDNGGVLGAWKDFGYANELERKDVEYLKFVCRPHIYCEDITSDTNGLVFEIKLNPHEIMLMHIYKKPC